MMGGQFAEGPKVHSLHETKYLTEILGTVFTMLSARDFKLQFVTNTGV